MAEDLTLTVPVNGKAPVDVLMQDPPAGPWGVDIVQIVQHTKKKPGEADSISLEATVTINEGDGAGMQTRLYIGMDWSKDFNVGHFVNLFTGIMENLGKTPEEIKAKLAGNVQVPLSSFAGKKAFVYVKGVPEGQLDAQGRKPLADKNFITKTQYEASKKAMATVGVVMGRGKAQAGVTGSGAPAAPGVNGTPASGTPQTPPPPATGGAAPGVGDLFS